MDPRARRRDAARGAPVHPGVPRPHGRHQVRRGGDGGPGAARGVRPRRRAAQVRRDEPGRRPRRRPGDHRLHGAPAHAGGVRRRPARLATRPRSRWPRWSSSARSTRTSSCGSTATASPRSGSAATTACCSAWRPRPAPGGEDVGFVGRIERVNIDVIDHIAQDYIPVIASVGADREGNSHNVNADEAAGAVARAMQAYKVMFLTDVAGWLRDPDDPSSVVCEATAAEVAAALDGVAGGMRPKLAGLRRRDPRRRDVRAHRRRPRPALPAARAVHRRRRRHQDPCRRAEPPRADLRALPVASSAARARACGTTRATSTWTSSAASASRASGTATRRVVAAVREQAGAADARRQPLLHRAGDARWPSGSSERSLRRQGVLRQLRRRGDRGGAQARAQGAAGRRHRRRRTARFHGRTYGALSATPQESKQAPFAPLVPGFRAVAPTPRRSRAAVDERTAAVLLEPIQGETRRARRCSDELLRAARAACDRARRGADLRRDPDAAWAAPARCGPTSSRACVPDAMTVAKALGGGLPIGALVTGPRLRDVLAPGDHGSTFAGGPVVAAAALAALDVIDDAGAARRACASWASGSRPGCASCRASRDVRGRGLMLRLRRSTATRPSSSAARCSSSASCSTRRARPRSACCRR